jgi:hypothetical protein
MRTPKKPPIAMWKSKFNSLRRDSSLTDAPMKLLPEGPPDPDIEGAWIAEAKRRHHELLDRRVKGIPGEQVFANVRALLARGSR